MKKHFVQAAAKISIIAAAVVMITSASQMTVRADDDGWGWDELISMRDKSDSELEAMGFTVVTEDQICPEGGYIDTSTLVFTNPSPGNSQQTVSAASAKKDVLPEVGCGGLIRTENVTHTLTAEDAFILGLPHVNVLGLSHVNNTVFSQVGKDKLKVPFSNVAVKVNQNAVFYSDDSNDLNVMIAVWANMPEEWRNNITAFGEPNFAALGFDDAGKVEISRDGISLYADDAGNGKDGSQAFGRLYVKGADMPADIGHAAIITNDMDDASFLAGVTHMMCHMAEISAPAGRFTLTDDQMLAVKAFSDKYPVMKNMTDANYKSEAVSQLMMYYLLNPDLTTRELPFAESVLIVEKQMTEPIFEATGDPVSADNK